jgi:hypothetical protein
MVARQLRRGSGGAVNDVPAIQWTDGRHELCKRLTEVHEDLGALYRYAIDLACSNPSGGGRRVRDALVGHCLRELMNNFPEAIGDVEDFPERGGRSESELREAVIGRFRALPSPDIDLSNPDGVITVTNGFVAAVRDWVEDQEQGTVRVQLRDSVTVLGRLDENNPALLPWRRARRFVMKLTHLNLSKDTVASASGNEGIKTHLENVEGALRARLGGFFEVLDEFEDILAEANAQTGEQPR